MVTENQIDGFGGVQIKMRELPKLKIQDLKVGMEVYIEQLSEIYDWWIFVDKKDVHDKKGIIKYIGKETSRKSREAWTHCRVLAPIYHDSMELEGDCYFDE